MKATKTWRDMLSKSLSDPNFRKEWEEANARQNHRGSCIGWAYAG